MLKNILNLQTKTITTSAFILAVAALGSALLGLLRDRLLAGRFGAGNELDMYYAAFRIPDFISIVLVMGAISAAIIPIFSSYWVRSQKEAWQFTSATLNLFLVSLIFICLLLFVLAPYLISLIAPGFQGEKREITVMLTRIMFLSPILLGISNIISGILQVFHRFLVTSLAPIMYNLGIIFGILFLVPKLGISGLAWGVAFGGALHLFIQLPTFFSAGFRPQRILTIFHPGVRNVIKLMLPRSLGLAASQINLIVITAIASTLLVGSIAIFNLANNLIWLLIAMIAISFSTATFPSLSLAFLKKDKEEFIQKFSSTFRQILFLIVPASLLMFLLRAQIVRLILGTGRFGWTETKLTAACLGLFSIGIFAYGFIILVSRAFYAIQNTKTPAFLSIFSMIINIGLSFLFVWLLKSSNIFQEFMANFLKLQGIENIALIGLPLAFSIVGIFQFILLTFFFYKKIGDIRLKEILRSFKKILFASILMVIFTYLVLQVGATFLNMQTFWGVFSQAALAGLTGIFIYVLVTFCLKSSEIKTIWSLILKQFKNNS